MILRQEPPASASYLFNADMVPYRELFLRRCPPPMLMPRGNRVCKKGVTKGWMYYLSQGLLKVYSSNSYGYDRVIAFLKDDNIFGLDCLDPDQPSVVTIECVTDSWVMPLQSEMLTGIMRESPDFACDLVAYYAKVMRQLCFDTENQSINDAKVRLVNFLYLYAESSGDDRIAMSQQDLAAAANCSRSSIARICTQLKEAGLIRVHGRGLTVLDRERLKAFCRL